MKFIFCMQINIKTCTSQIIVFDESSQTYPKYPKYEVCRIFEIYKGNVLQLFLCSIVRQNINILYGVPVMFVVTCFWVVVVKNGHSLLDYGTLKSAVSQE